MANNYAKTDIEDETENNEEKKTIENEVYKTIDENNNQIMGEEVKELNNNKETDKKSMRPNNITRAFQTRVSINKTSYKPVLVITRAQKQI